MTDPRETLARIRAQADAATEGPWEAEYSGEQGNCVLPPGYRSTREAVAVTRLWRASADAEFIAAARTNVPALLDALEAVLKVHAPIDALMFSGRHQRMVAVCVGCGTDDGNWQRYPCPTVTAITTALEGETNE